MQAEKWGLCPFWGGELVPHLAMWPGPRPTCMPSFMLIHATVWPQYTNITDRQPGQDRKDRTTVRQHRANRFTNGRPIKNCSDIHSFMLEFSFAQNSSKIFMKSLTNFSGIEIGSYVTLFLTKLFKIKSSCSSTGS